MCEQGVTLASNLDNLDRSTHESVGAPTLARDYAAASSDNGNDNGKRATERQREVVYSLIEEHTKQYLEDPKVKPDYLNLEEWLTRSIFNETGIDIPRIKQILVVFPFSDDLKQAMGISVGGGE